MVGEDARSDADDEEDDAYDNHAPAVLGAQAANPGLRGRAVPGGRVLFVICICHNRRYLLKMTVILNNIIAIVPNDRQAGTMAQWLILHDEIVTERAEGYMPISPSGFSASTSGRSARVSMPKCCKNLSVVP